MTDPVIAFYDDNAQDFFARTVDADMSHEQERFIGLLPAGAHVLDAGCGSGRDARAFRDRGLAVTAMEAAPKLAALAETHIGVPVRVMTFDQVDWSEAFEGVWANASLLHVPLRDLPDAIGRLRDALVPGGVLYMSFKRGVGERPRNGRHFTDMDETGGRALVEAVGGLDLLDVTHSEDGRADHRGEWWTALWCRKTQARP